MGTPVNIFRHKLVQIIIIFIGIVLIINLSKDILRLLKAAEELKLVQQRIEKLEEERENLVEKKEYYQSEAFIEQEARNKLNMVKEGETIVILPPNIKEVLGKKEASLSEPQPNWRQWLELFL